MLYFFLSPPEWLVKLKWYMTFWSVHDLFHWTLNLRWNTAVGYPTLTNHIGNIWEYSNDVWGEKKLLSCTNQEVALRKWLRIPMMMAKKKKFKSTIDVNNHSKEDSLCGQKESPKIIVGEMPCYRSCEKSPKFDQMWPIWPHLKDYHKMP